MRLKARFILALTVAALLPAILVAYLVGKELIEGSRRETVESNRRELAIAAFAVQGYLRRAVDLVATHAERSRLLTGLATRSPEMFALVFRGLDRKKTGFETIFVVDAQGTMRFHNTDPSVVGKDFSGRDYYRGVLRNGRPYVSTPYIGRATKQPTIAVAAPIRDESGRLQGILCGTLTLRALSQMAASLPGMHDSHMMLVGPGGVILAHKEAGRRMQPAGPDDPTIAKVLRGERGWEIWRDREGAKQVTVFAPIDGFGGWGLVHTQPLAEVYAPLWASGRRVLLITTLALGLAALGGILLAQGLARPILGLREGVRRLGGGDLRARLNLRRADELGELARDFDAMAERLEMQVRELERRMRELALLQELDQGILAAKPISELLQRAVQGFGDMAGDSTCSLVAPEGDDGLLRLVAAPREMYENLRRHFDEIRQRVPEGLAGLAIALRMPVASADVTTDTRWGRLQEAILARGIRAAAAVPLVAGDEVLGAILLSYPTPRLFPEEELQSLQRFAGQLAIALQQARLREAAAEGFRLEAAHRAKSLFVANMSHEIRTPLTSILGFAEMLQTNAFGPLNEKQHRYAGHILQAGQHLLALINDVLDLSKAEAGRFKITPETLSLAATLEAALLMVKGSAIKKQIHLGLEMEEGLETVWADPIRLKQMLYNLLGNAVKFTPAAGSVTLAARRVAGKVEIAVRDTGIGIKAEDLPRLFTEFSQIGSQWQEGTGLGLALTKRLAELHGGSIRVESTPGKGSTFTLEIPERRPGEVARMEASREAPLPIERQAKVA